MRFNSQMGQLFCCDKFLVSVCGCLTWVVNVPISDWQN